MNSYKSKAVFHLPGMFMHCLILLQLLEEVESNPQILKDNVEIGSIYGSPCGIWNGGRIVIQDSLMSTERLLLIRDLMKDYGIPVRFTFTNCLLEEIHLQDEYCNSLLEMYNTGNNEILCNSSLLESYIRDKYSDRYRYVSSTTKRLSNRVDQISEINKDYYLVVVDYDYNKDFRFLSSIEHKSKCELLCNAVCPPNCSQRSKHYQLISRGQLTHSPINFRCEYEGRDFYLVKQDPSLNFISVEDINETYLPLGFSNFKLEGRTNRPLDLIEILIYYIIKDEYALEIRQKLHKIVTL